MRELIIRTFTIRRRSVVCGLRRSLAGFTLIELLVAMAILMVIVMMMGNLFQQSTRAWDTGIRQAEAGLEARAVIGMIQNELSQAIATTGMPFTASGSTLDFWTLGAASETNREPRNVKYSVSGGTLTKTSNGNTNTLLQLDAFSVDTPFVPDPDKSTNLPDWVEMTLKVSASSENSAVRVYAKDREYDPNGVDWVDTRRK